MSGGSLCEYDQRRIEYIIEGIERAILNNNCPNEDGYCNNYSIETIEQFEKAIPILKIAYIFAQRIDWLVSGDDSEDSFHKRLSEELNYLADEFDDYSTFAKIIQLLTE